MIIDIYLSLLLSLSISRFPLPFFKFELKQSRENKGREAPEKANPIKKCSSFASEDAADISLTYIFMNNIISRNGKNTTQACAACKYQRKKCGPNCIFALYFSHDHKRQFLNAHKLFGVGKISDMIKPLDPPDRDIAMRTIIYQSDMRANDPVGGCHSYIQELQAQIEYSTAELQLVLQQLAIFRAQAHQQQAQAQAQLQALHVYNPTTTHPSVNADEIMHADPLTLYDPAAPVASTPHYHYLQHVPQQEQYIMDQETSNNNGTPFQENVNTWAMQNSIPLSSLSLKGKKGNASVGDEYDHKPMLDLLMKEMNSDSTPKHKSSAVMKQFCLR